MSMNDSEECELTEALKTGDVLVVEGHSGHKIRQYCDSLPFLAARAGIYKDCLPVSLLVSSLEHMLAYLNRCDLSQRHVFFVNTDLCPINAVILALQNCGISSRVRRLRLRKLHHNCPETLQLLHTMEKGNVETSKVFLLKHCYTGMVQFPLIIPEETDISKRVSRVFNSLYSVCDAIMGDVHSFYAKWISVDDGKQWTDTYIFERILPPIPCKVQLISLRNVVESTLRRDVVLFDVSNYRECIERVALCFPFSPSEMGGTSEVFSRLIAIVRNMGWILVSQTATPSSCEMPNRVIHLWRGARVAFKDGGMGSVVGFKKETFPKWESNVEWPLVVRDDEKSAKIVLPSLVPLHKFSTFQVLELPLRYGDTITAEQLFRTPYSSLVGRCWSMRPSLFIGHLPRLRCALTSVPSLSQITLTSPLPLGMIMAVEKRW
ncbi:uncharacterized protein TM35_000172870 [Trypanosoma theileri]|uniref:Uncharacterized protein n=1 Tax=Trypanosoma theileri TaxID=67003 RepID=A0A1X0NUP7_9TRYP|nr:uncharacterized protein TM35_000172870 [Trypanosoma theileri]ORC88415.1 hypothetical protein TM35_000172870 [Trypanosoma theileri]